MPNIPPLKLITNNKTNNPKITTIPIHPIPTTSPTPPIPPSLPPTKITAIPTPLQVMLTAQTIPIIT